MAGAPVTEVLAISTARTNAHLIEQVVQLGYLSRSHITLDPTYGKGGFWRRWRPDVLVAADLDPARSRVGFPVDFTELPWPRCFDAVVFDPPYKLNGTGGSLASDDRYGVATRGISWQARHAMICDGITDAIRVLVPGGTLLVKCQDQVCAGAVRWQTREFADHAERAGCTLIDQLHLVGHRPQPPGRNQYHARRNYSTLLVLRKARR
jgi:hypothetical protein